MNYCVLTTINKPTKAIEELYKKFGNNLIIVGDKKTPNDWDYNGIKPILGTTSFAPDNHYAKKNLGYLEAMKKGAKLIYDTDDDNIPNDTWSIRKLETETDFSKTEKGWYNVYSYFKTNIWPRGFPLNMIGQTTASSAGHGVVLSSIQQGLSDGEPDVDSIARLVLKDRDTIFADTRSINLQPYTWSPFNSQTTWWFPKAFPLMYLPVNCSFRMTDIWRSFIAQRCLWEIGEGVTFHSPSEVIQERNDHNLMKDFEDEVPGYLLNEKIIEVLNDLFLKSGEEFMCENLLTCYEALVTNKILPLKEIDSVKKWISAYETTRNLE